MNTIVVLMVAGFTIEGIDYVRLVRALKKTLHPQRGLIGKSD
jgi:hypothetical protein